MVDQFDPQPTLLGELLELRPLRPDDFAALYGAAKDPLIWEQHPEHDRWTPPVFERFFAEAIASGGALVAIDRRDGRIIGSSRYHDHDPVAGTVEVGWSFLTRDYWGGRYNGEMKQLMLQHAFRWLNEVHLVIGAGNIRSRKAAEKIGATLAKSFQDPQGRDKVVYAVTPRTFRRPG
jgi:RimJ/RimL family protein N-acetyltransferase